jgi:hypothetical protein
MVNNLKIRKKRVFVPNDKKDDTYWKKRKLNTIYAKRSRDRKRKLDQDRELKLKELIEENQKLKYRIDELTNLFFNLTDEIELNSILTYDVLDLKDTFEL